MIPRSFQNVLLVVTLLATAALNCRAAEVVFVGSSVTQSRVEKHAKIAATFYGLEERSLVLDEASESSTILKTLANRGTVAVILSADVLPFLDVQRIFVALKRKEGSIPLLITGIDDHTRPELLKRWSAGAITRCDKLRIAKESHYEVLDVDGVSLELAGSELPLNKDEISYLTLDGRHSGAILVANGIEHTVFTRVMNGTHEVFFATENGPDNVPIGPSPYNELLVFANLAPELMFLHHAGGVRIWHSPAHYANLTIDDAWLREPYGYVNYNGLLAEMQRHNFHTTIAFVPWNFDRSQPGVVSLFQKNQNRFSICIHGNNHDHQEFGAYDNKPLNGQENDVKQGLARMEKFKELTQLSYDPVMVFPHSVSPAQTFALLKRYNLWATANSLNVPMGSEPPSDAEFSLRTVTMEFEDFPSMRRYSAEAPGPQAQLAVDAFLGNPMLFYVHQGFFASGIEAFDGTADIVNRLEPGTKWSSLGDVARHLYLEKLRDDDNYDIRAFSSEIDLTNHHATDATFFVQKDEDFTLPLTVLMDGKSYPYQRSGNKLMLSVVIRAGESRNIAVVYTNDLRLSAIDTSRHSVRVRAIRYLSDFRDEVVSKTTVGRSLIHGYADNYDRWNRFALISTSLFGLVFASSWCFRRSRKRSQLKRQ